MTDDEAREERANLANVNRRLDYLAAHGRPLPRAPIQPIPRRGPSPCRVCGAVNCASPECFRMIMFRMGLERHGANGRGRA
jgi:hypothetical protein